MTLKVVATPESRETLTVTYNLIREKFGLNAANKFLAKVDKTVSLIAKQPFMFKASTVDENVRIGFIAEQCSLMYRVAGNKIYLICFWDNRQEPILP